MKRRGRGEAMLNRAPRGLAKYAAAHLYSRISTTLLEGACRGVGVGHASFSSSSNDATAQPVSTQYFHSLDCGGMMIPHGNKGTNHKLNSFFLGAHFCCRSVSFAYKINPKILSRHKNAVPAHALADTA